ncbi:hypothetical protein PFISCL1PPCAC_15186, partial [Pristionchus fissidentatus]
AVLMSSPLVEEERERSRSLIEEDKEDEDNEIEEIERGSEDGGIHDELIDAVARGIEDPEMLREQDRFLPICNISRIMRRMVPDSGKMSKDSKEAVQEAVSEFISFITSEASDKCIEEQRKTITCDDLLNAIEMMGFDKYVEPLKIFLTRYRDATRVDRPSDEVDGRSPTPPSSSVPLPPPPASSSVPLVISGPGGHIAPAAAAVHSVAAAPQAQQPMRVQPPCQPKGMTAILNTPSGPVKAFFPNGFVPGENGTLLCKPFQKLPVNGEHMKRSDQPGPSRRSETPPGPSTSNGHSRIVPKHPQIASTSTGGEPKRAPMKIFIDQSTGQRYRSIIDEDGKQRLTPINIPTQNLRMIKRPVSSIPSSSSSNSRPSLDTNLPSTSSSSHSDHHNRHQSPQVSSTTHQSHSQSQSQSRPHPHYQHRPQSSHLSFQLASSSSSSSQSHPSTSSTQYHHSHSQSYSSSHNPPTTHHSMPPPSLPHPPPPPSSLPPSASTSTNYIQLLPQQQSPSVHPSSFPPSQTPTTSAQSQYNVHYQDHPQQMQQSVMGDGRGQSMNGMKRGEEGEKRRISSSIVNTKWNPSSGQYVVDTTRTEIPAATKRRRTNEMEE